MEQQTPKDPIITKLYGFQQLNVQKTKHNQYEQKNPIENPSFILQPNALVGIEIEVENMNNGGWIPEYYWNCKEDHSLRNNGLEFTSIPLRGHQIESALKFLFEEFTLTGNTEFTFGNRTSTHIHLNVRDLTWDNIKSLLLLYCIFEKHFFTLAGTKRESSIFCVPMYRTHQASVIPNINSFDRTWHKYSAINAGTILGNEDVPKFGTIEFRHLYGTSNIDTIINWINNIFCLRVACQQYTFEELLEKLNTLNSTSEYINLYQTIFKQYALPDLLKRNNWKQFESCITALKLNLIKEKYTVSYVIESVFGTHQKEKKQPTEKQSNIEDLLKEIDNETNKHTLKVKNANYFTWTQAPTVQTVHIAEPLTGQGF